MKKIKKILFIALFVGIIFTNTIFAANIDNPDAPKLPSSGNSTILQLENASGKIWSTFAVIAQILAIMAIVFTGLRYMFTSADDRADIKLQTLILILGSVLVFAAVPFAKFIIRMVDEIF